MWVLAGIGLALLIWLPNLAWQATHGFPQLALAGGIAADTSAGDLLLVAALQPILAGAFLFPLFFTGLWWLLRAQDGHTGRALGWAYLGILALTLVTRGKLYYPVGLVPVILAAAAAPLDRWLARGRSRLRTMGFAAAAGGSLAVGALIGLPLLPPSLLAHLPSDLNAAAAEQIGWPELVVGVQSVVDGLPHADASRAVVLTANYGEAGALTLLGGERLPPVFSGHNAFWDWGPPPEVRDVVVVVGNWSPDQLGQFGACEQQATLGNRFGIDNEERGAGVWVCRGMPRPWSRAWRRLRHLD